MLRKGWLALYVTLLMTIALVFCFLFFGGSTAVTSLVAVLGFLLAIIEFFYLHVLSVHHEPRSSNSTRQVWFDSEKTLPSSRRGFRRSLFSRREDDD